jgi:hypothetical protein
MLRSEEGMPDELVRRVQVAARIRGPGLLVRVVENVGMAGDGSALRSRSARFFYDPDRDESVATVTAEDGDDGVVQLAGEVEEHIVNALSAAQDLDRQQRLRGRLWGDDSLRRRLGALAEDHITDVRAIYEPGSPTASLWFIGAGDGRPPVAGVEVGDEEFAGRAIEIRYDPRTMDPRSASTFAVFGEELVPEVTIEERAVSEMDSDRPRGRILNGTRYGRDGSPEPLGMSEMDEAFGQVLRGTLGVLRAASGRRLSSRGRGVESIERALDFLGPDDYKNATD